VDVIAVLGELTVNCTVGKGQVYTEKLDDRFLEEQNEWPAQRTDNKLPPAKMMCKHREHRKNT
jgi:hypothetical protein